MRIGFFVSSFPELSETFLLQQVVGLLERGHDVRILAHSEDSGDAVHEAVEEYGLRCLVRVLSRDRVEPSVASVLAVARSAARIPSSYARAVGGLRTLSRTVAALASEEPVDVVHCHYGDVGLHYGVAAQLWRVPLVTSFYGYDCSSYPRARGMRVFEPLFAKAQAVTVLSEQMRQRVRELGCPDALIHLVPLAVDPAIGEPIERRPPRDGEPARLLTVARLTEKKGIEYALRALALIADEFPDARYDVIGTGSLLGELEELAASLGVGERTQFLGARTGADVREAFRDAHVFVLPSVTATNGDEEGTPAVLLEAAFARLPVLATRHAGIPEIVRDGVSGYLVPERDAGALAAVMRQLLRDPDQWAAMGEEGRRHVEATHSRAAVARRLETLYGALVNG